MRYKSQGSLIAKDNLVLERILADNCHIHLSLVLPFLFIHTQNINLYQWVTFFWNTTSFIEVKQCNTRITQSCWCVSYHFLFPSRQSYLTPGGVRGSRKVIHTHTSVAQRVPKARTPACDWNIEAHGHPRPWTWPHGNKLPLPVSHSWSIGFPLPPLPSFRPSSSRNVFGLSWN